MKKKFKVENFKESLPNYALNGEIELSTKLIAKHYLDEQAENYNWIELAIEQYRFFNRLQRDTFFKYKPNYKPPYTESKKGFSNILGRALAKAVLDKYEDVYFFDDFDSYYKNSKKRKYLNYKNNIITSKIHSKERGPDLLCKDRNQEFVIAECKGRLQKYRESDLKTFINQSRNALVQDEKGNNYRTKNFAVPFYISYSSDNSIVSVVDPPGEGRSAKEDDLNLVERFHYHKVLRNLGYDEMANRLLYDTNQEEGNIKYSISVIKTKFDNNQYVVPDYIRTYPPFFDFHPIYNQNIYCLELRRFELLKNILQGNSNSFGELYLSNNKENFDLSNDGSILISGSDIRNINEIEI